MNLNNAKNFGKAIKEYRKKQSITQAQLAGIANTGIRFISDLENGKPTTQLEKALKVANLLGLEFEVKNKDIK